MAIIGFVFTLVLPILLGGLLASPFHRFRGKSGWFAAGTLTGLVFFTWFNFLFSLFFQAITWKGIFLSLLCLGILSIWISRNKNKWAGELKNPEENIGFYSKKSQISCVLILLFLGILVILCMREVIHIGPEGYFIGFRNNLGDLPLHIHYITSFLFADNLPPKNPIFSGLPLRYPFLCDFYSAIFWFATGKMEASLEIPGMVLGISFLIIFYQWTVRLTSSHLAGAIAPLLFFLNGSMGWWIWIRDLFHGKVFSHSYSMYSKGGFEWGNIFYTLWVPQRSLQFAFPLILFLWAIALEAAKEKNTRKFLFLAFLAGGLPFFHGHAVIVLTVIGCGLLIRYPSKSWLFLLIPLTLFWFPQVLYLAQMIGGKSLESLSFIHFDFGWQSKGFEVFWFWLKNTGPFIPLLIWSFWVFHKKKSNQEGPILFALGGLVIFLLGNLVVFAPWSWDNFKILIFWYLACLPLVSLGLVSIIRSRFLWLRPLAFICIFMLIFSGILDLSHALWKRGENNLFLSISQIKVSEKIKAQTPKKALILIAPTYNSAVVLTGRGLFMGYEGHIWSHGYNSRKRKTNLKKMVKGDDQAKTLFNQYGITHILYGGREKQEGFDRNYFDREFTLIFQNDGFRLYETLI